MRHSEALDPAPFDAKLTEDATPIPLNGGPARTALTLDKAGLGVGQWVSILGTSHRVHAVDQANTKKVEVVPPMPAAQPWKTDTVVRKLRQANTAHPQNGSRTITVSGANRLYRGALVGLDNGADKEYFTVDSVDGNEVRLSRGTTKQYLEGQSLALVEVAVQVRYAVDGSVEADETFENLRLTANESASSLTAVVNRGSSLVRVTNPNAGQNVTLDTLPVCKTGGWDRLTGGADNYGSLTVDDFIGEDDGEGNRSGIASLEDIDDLSLVMVPGMWAPTVRSALVTHCESMRYRFAIVDPPPGLGIQAVREYRNPIDTRFAALYYPWLEVRDPLLQANVAAPPSGHMAGIYARVDGERGVHKAPANEVIRSITDLHQSITKREQDLLNPDNVNALRYFPGRGRRVWGARTLSSDSNWRYVNVRRTFIFVERSIDEGTQWVVFEPNDQNLWARVRQTVSAFLNGLWRNGILEGATAEDAFYVACDRGVTMTQEDIENGRLVCEVGIAPVYPAEFVVFRIQKYTAESKLA